MTPSIILRNPCDRAEMMARIAIQFAAEFPRETRRAGFRGGVAYQRFLPWQSYVAYWTKAGAVVVCREVTP